MGSIFIFYNKLFGSFELFFIEFPSQLTLLQTKLGLVQIVFEYKCFWNGPKQGSNIKSRFRLGQKSVELLSKCFGPTYRRTYHEKVIYIFSKQYVFMNLSRSGKTDWMNKLCEFNNCLHFNDSNVIISQREFISWM